VTLRRPALSIAIVVLVAVGAACGKKKPVVATAPAPNPFPNASAASNGPAETPPAPPAPIASDNVTARPLDRTYDSQSIDQINGPNSPLKPAFFSYDSDDLDDAAKKALDADAGILKTYGTWVVTIEGHCDERGTAEYNLALGDRRALSAKNYLVSLGVEASRIRTVSYGKEFPFDAAHDESAYSKNRRAHIMLTSK
jgi:peptidoglycan-associated lipoprotein